VTGLNGHRVYLDWNATAPLRLEARRAMLEMIDAHGNPSSVHAEGRAARVIVESARSRVAALAGCEPADLVFTSGATEAAATVLAQARFDNILFGETEHDCIARARRGVAVAVTRDGLLGPGFFRQLSDCQPEERLLVAMAAANGETGVINDRIGEIASSVRRTGGELLCDMVQAFGKVPVAAMEGVPDYRLISGHKIGAPKGVGAIVLRPGTPIIPLLSGGGQELGRRSGTENVIGIAGFGAAAEAARRDLESGAWERAGNLRDRLEERLESAAPDLVVFGRGAPRLPNTSCFAVPGWKGETQVMQMDLAGFAVSAGSACSSGKVAKASRVLMAMGFDEVTAASAIRVSMGPTTSEAEVMAFADTWIDHYRKRIARAA